MKTILLPTDLQIESLNLFSHAIHKNSTTELNIILLTGIRSSDSIVELLFPSRTEYAGLISKDFKNAYEIIKNRNASIVKSIRVEFFSGISRNAARNFIDANGVDEIFLPRDYKLNLSARGSFDIIPLLKGHPIATHEVSWTIHNHQPEKNLPAELFLFGSEFKTESR
jgi:hypothetical protein